MPIFELSTDTIRGLETTSFSLAGVKERSGLQRLLRDQIDVVAPGTLVIAEEFGEWTDSRRRIDQALDEDQFGQDVRVVLVSADFSRELTTAVMWLNDKGLDIRCVRIRPYSLEDRTLIDVQQVIPLPEAADYQVRVREKKLRERRARHSGIDFTRFDVSIAATTHANQWKRNAILLVVKKLCRQGVSPDTIADVLAEVRGRNRIWRSLDGVVPSAEEFTARASAEAEARGDRFDERRWHTRDGDLVVHEGETYVFTNQWGHTWAPAMELLKNGFPQLRLEWRPAE